MEKYLFILSWEIKRSGKVKEISTLDRIEYECFKEYLRENNHLFEIYEDYVLVVD